MTQRSESTTSTPAQEADDPACRTPAAAAAPPLAPPQPPYPPLAEPRPLGERRVWPRTFHDRLTAPLPGLKALARFAREGAVRPGREGLADIPRLPFEPGPLPRVDARTLAVTWAGHASWVLRVGGLTVLTDPVWSRRILGTPARITPVGVPWDRLPRVDAVVVSHNHYDHLDAPPRCAGCRATHRCSSRPGWAAGSSAAGSPGSPSWTGGRRPHWTGCASTSSRPTTGPSAP
ncbi:hypothetical protein GCM10020295_14090 [Streptomyces cinereospinus]